MDDILLDVKLLDKNFSGVHALKHVSFQVKYGEVHALMGENGAGKSTLIKVLTGIYPKDGGKICLAGKELPYNNPISISKQGISTVYQELNLIPNLTVYENMFLGREIERKGGILLERNFMKLRAKEQLAQIGVAIDVTKRLDNYSTAVQQMIAIARAISVNCKLVIMDEPTSSLDKREVQVLLNIILMLKKQGISTIFISHKLDEVFAIADRMTILKDGECVGTYQTKDLSQLKLVSLMLGKNSIHQEVEKRDYKFGDSTEILKVSNIKQGMRLHGIGITVKEGEILGLAGLLGCGRTELAHVIFGSSTPDSGEIYWLGQKVCFKNPAQAIKQGLGFCTEDRKSEGIVPNMSVSDNLSLAILPQLQKLGIIDNSARKDLVNKYVKLLRIKTSDPEQQLIKNLSGGNQQKVLLARWLCRQPRLMILDEPNRGIDIGAKSEIEMLIQDLAKQGISILMISSELEELERNCDRVVVINNGKNVGQLQGKEITQANIMQLIVDGKDLS